MKKISKQKTKWMLPVLLLVSALICTAEVNVTDSVFFGDHWNNKLAPQSVFGPLADYQIKEVALLEYLLICHLEKDPEMFSVENVYLEENISEQTSVSFDLRHSEIIDENSRLIPCRVNENTYFGVITHDKNNDTFLVTIVTEREKQSFVSISVQGIREERHLIDRYIRHEETQDTFLKNLKREIEKS